jgi:hypothetical protein
MSFDQRIENLDKLIQLLAAQPAYIPNEPELSVAGLTTTLNTMRTTNTTAVNAYTPVSNARINRNTILYAESTGLVDYSRRCKKLCKIRIRCYKSTIQTSKRTKIYQSKAITNSTRLILNRFLPPYFWRNLFLFEKTDYLTL